MTIRSKQVYVAIAGLTALVLLLLFVFGKVEYFEDLAAIPLFSGMAAALFVLVRDHAAHERAQQLIDTSNNFLVGASSHMANVAFDKHVEFAEEYVKEAQETLDTFFREGPTEKALEHASTLYQVQKKYVVWLTESIEEQLEVFESALRTIGAAAHLESRAETYGSEARVAVMFEAFAEVLGQEKLGSDEWDGKKLSEDRAVSTLIRRLRVVLGTEELTKLRREIIRNAVSKVKDNG